MAKAYYWHRFFAHQPNLNYRNPQVLQAILDVLDFWLDMGVDGFRLDPVPYLVEADGTSSENLAQTHDILKRIRKHVDQRYDNRVLLAEANQWPEEAAGYFGNGDECHIAFHFPLMPRLFMALQQEDRFPILDIYAQTPPIPEGCQWGLFLRNHDELSLEMVTEEDRMFMYQNYAQDPAARLNLGIRRRLAPLLRNDRRQIELMNWLLFSLPGTPILYYGDEIGMGDNIYLGDRESVRTPMQWSPDRNAGFSQCPPQRLYLPLIIDHEYHHESVHVEGQANNSRSLLSWMKQLITLRKQHLAFSRGSLRFLYPSNRKVLAYVRSYEEEHILVVVNLSGFTQPVELQLDAWLGHAPRDLIGGTEFPAISERPYLLTLSPYAVLGFGLGGKPKVLDQGHSKREVAVPVFALIQKWEEVFYEDCRILLEHELLKHLERSSWMKQRNRRPVSLTIINVIQEFRPGLRLLFVSTRFAEYGTGLFLIPVAHADASRVGHIPSDKVLARLSPGDMSQTGVSFIYQPASAVAFNWDFLKPLLSRGGLAGNQGRIRMDPVRGTAPIEMIGEDEPREIAHIAGRSLNNTTLLFGERFVVKLFRILETAPNPESEIGAYLTERGYAYTPRLLGSIQYENARDEPVVCGVVHEYMANQGDLWEMGQESLQAAFTAKKRARCSIRSGPPLAGIGGESAIPNPAREMIGPFLEKAQQIGQEISALHLALAANPEPSFAPEPFTTWHQESLYQRIRTSFLVLAAQVRAALSDPAPPDQKVAEEFLAYEETLLRFLRTALKQKLCAMRIRCHGNLHLGQVLCSEGKLVIIDFEGEPTRAVFERRLKQCPLVDLVTMMRSFQMAAQRALAGHQRGIGDEGPVEEISRSWTYWTTSAYLGAYWSRPGMDDLLKHRDHCALLLRIFLIERALFEMRAELSTGGEWVSLIAKQTSELIGRALPI